MVEMKEIEIRYDVETLHFDYRNFSKDRIKEEKKHIFLYLFSRYKFRKYGCSFTTNFLANNIEKQVI